MNLAFYVELGKNLFKTGSKPVLNRFRTCFFSGNTASFVFYHTANDAILCPPKNFFLQEQKDFLKRVDYTQVLKKLLARQKVLLPFKLLNGE